MFGGWSNIPAVLTMKCPGGTFCGLVVDDHFGAWWQKGMLVEVVCALEVGVGGERGVDAGSPEKVTLE